MNKYYINEFGARPDGKICTAQIQKAIDKCFLSGGGEVIVPEGVFLTGGLRLRSNVNLHLLENAVLSGSVNPEDYFSYLDDNIEPITEKMRNKKAPTAMPQSEGASIYPFSRWNNAVIRAIGAENVSITGEKGSVIDGRNCYDEQGEENYRGPHGINMWYCKNITLCGYTIRNSGNWAHAIQNSVNISAKDITVLGGHDGFDVRTCDDITVSDCKFYSGDDAIAGFDNINVLIKNCLLNSSCSALRFGGTNVIVENCETNSENKYGFRGALTEEEKKNRAEVQPSSGRFNCLNVFLYYCDYRARVRKTPGNIVIRNCDFKHTDAVFSQPFGAVWACNRGLNDILFENCTFGGICNSINIDCPENEPITFKMKNCKIEAKKGAEKTLFMGANNFENIIFENVEISGYKNPEIAYSTPGNIRIDGGTEILSKKSEKCIRSAQ